MRLSNFMYCVDIVVRFMLLVVGIRVVNVCLFRSVVRECFIEMVVNIFINCCGGVFIDCVLSSKVERYDVGYFVVEYISLIL